MEASSSSPLSLLCDEENSCLDEDEHNLENQFLNSEILCCDLDDDYVKLLVQKEASNCFGSSSKSSSWLKNARLDAIDWILNTQTLMGFRNQTAYLSVAYFDRFLSIRFIDEGKFWAIRLLSVACLSLAAKMEERRVPSLSEYPIEDYGFDCKLIRKMELFVLSDMGWNMSLITPFSYLYYFIIKLGDNQGIKLHELISKATQLIMSIIKEINSVDDHQPSMIAGVAVLAAANGQLTQEALKLKLSTISLWDTSEKLQEQLFSCYSLMQRLSPMVNLSTPNLSEVHQTISATTRIVGTKRRLSFSDSDGNPSLLEKIHRG